MARSKAYKYTIKQNTPDSHQSSPGYLLTFIRWFNRDTQNYSPDGQRVRGNFTVINDCVSITVKNTKKGHITNCNMVLRAGDINYSTAVAPGDFVLVNMLEDESKILELRGRALGGRAINKFNDGFKGVFKITSVRRNLSVNPSNGQKSLTYQISADGFTEFNQVIYFNQYLYGKEEQQGDTFRLAGASKEWNSLKKKDLFKSLDVTFNRLTEFLIGNGFPNDFAQNKGKEIRNHNQKFLLPKSLGPLLGLRRAKKAKDLFKYIAGVEQYSGTASNAARGLNPSRLKSMTGTAFLKGEYWSQITAWSILQQYSNSLINEMYTTYKTDKKGNVLPFVVFRQKPFTTEHFNTSVFLNGDTNVTRFMNLPRWEVVPERIYSYDLGRNDAARINFVQIIGTNRDIPTSNKLAIQSALKNFQTDGDDIFRNGLRPYIQNANFDYFGDNNKGSLAPDWSHLCYDWLVNGHLKENGTIICTGIEDPISVGDNLQIDNIVFHIEGIIHSMSINPQGVKQFRTTIQLSHGTDVRSGSSPVYPEMDFTDVLTRRKDDYENGDKVYPGFSGTQDVPGREKGEEIRETRERSYTEK